MCLIEDQADLGVLMPKKIKDNKEKKVKKAVKEKMGLFNQIPECCDGCEAPFDKRNREQVFSWTVVVRKDKEDNPVRLYCPPCWEEAQNIVKEIVEKGVENARSAGTEEHKTDPAV